MRLDSQLHRVLGRLKMTLCRGTLCLLCASEQEFDEVAAITALINQGSSGVEYGEEAADEAHGEY